MELIKSMLQSKKFIVLLIAIILIIICTYLQIDTNIVFTTVGAISAYLIGQGLADVGKEAEKGNQKKDDST